MSYSKISGIYLINCLASQKVYVGSAVSVKQRLACHRSMLRNNSHTNKHLQNAFNKYGECSFVMELIEECKVDDLIKREQAWIDYYDASNSEYGLNNSPTATTTIGFRHSEETRKKLSELASNRGNDHLLAYAESMKGKPSPNKGMPVRKWTEAEKIAASKSRKGRKPWNKGIPKSE